MDRKTKKRMEPTSDRQQNIEIVKITYHKVKDLTDDQGEDISQSHSLHFLENTGFTENNVLRQNN